MKPIDSMTIDELHRLENAIHEKRMGLERIRSREWQAADLEKPDAEPVTWLGEIGHFCEDIVYHAKRLNRPVRGKYNSTPITAYPDSSPGDLCRAYFEARK
jgi:hypothetical protein